MTAIFFLMLVPAVAAGGLEMFDLPRELDAKDVRFPAAGSLGDELVVLYQQVVSSDNRDGGDIFLRALVSRDAGAWDGTDILDQAIPYSSESPPTIFSSLFTENEILLAVAESETEIRIYRIRDAALQSELVTTISTRGEFVAPRLFGSAENGYHLFANRHSDFRIDIYAASSSDGAVWTDFLRFSKLDEQTLNFNPSYAYFQGHDVVVYQGLDPTVAGAYQLYLRWREHPADDWSDPRQITKFSAGGNESADYDNQRPSLSVHDDRLYITWERRFQTQTRQVFFGSLGEEFGFDTLPEQVSTGFSNANAPRTVVHNDELAVAWLRSRSEGDEIILAQRDGIEWDSEVMGSGLAGSASFPLFVVHQGRLHILWQNRRNGETRLGYQPPDQHVDPPQLQALDFPAGGRSRQNSVRVDIIAPDDPSGIAGYRYTWGGNPVPVVSTDGAPIRIDRLQLNADTDGRWYLHVRAQDRAGNWSRPATISFERDRTPPPSVEFEPLERDEEGFLVSNSFTVAWKPSPDDSVVGYSYRYQRLGPPTADFPDPEVAGIVTPLAAVMTRDTSFSRQNEDNGLWVLAVSAIDDVGNRSEPAYRFLPLNKYIPFTIVRMVNAESDAVGRMQLEISGRGFAADGRIETIELENIETGRVSYRFEHEFGDYRLESDRRISGITIARPLAGRYRIRLLHSERGAYVVERLLEVDTSGTVKFGDFSLGYQSDWAVRSGRPAIIFSYSSVWFWLLMLLLLTLAVFSGLKLLHITVEAQTVRLEAAALLKGEVMKLSAPSPAVIRRAARRGAGLRIKFTIFAALLVTSVVLMVAVTLGSFVLDTQSRTLSQGLQDRVEVLLESVVSGAAGFLPAPEGNIPELNALTNQIAVMPEAMHLTITGRGRDDVRQFNYIWATNNPELTDGLRRGETRIEDKLSETASQLEERINTAAQETLGDIARQIDDFTADIVRLALEDSREAELQRADIDARRSELETQLISRLNEIGGGARSKPEFDPDSLSDDQTEYIFYQPVLYRSPNENIYYRGMVRLTISTELILEEIAASQRTLIITTIIIALIAVGLGVVGALVLATIIIIPINRLVRGVEEIRITEDKRQLRNHTIQVRTRDELQVLAESVNQMTQGLVKAAEANEELTIGKEVQKMFIPLAQKDNKTKYSTGKEENDTYEFFGYYEGAKTVSGDYFSFSQLDPHTYSLIKCDVAGKGVSAALIMVEVATLFMDHFRGWNDSRLSGKALLQRRSQLRDLDGLLVGMNDLLEKTALAGRFAALTVGLLDIDAHRLTLANAGDNQVHMYRSGSRRTEQYAMPDAPAAGVFSSDFIPNGYKPAVYQLEVGDIVLFFTDGLEEAKRILRDSDYRPTENAEGVGDEEFSIERIHRVAEAVQSQGVYYLERELNPLPEEELKFDFQGVEPTAENTVLALVAVEKIIRTYLDPQAGPDDRVVVDRVVDDFLQQCFGSYHLYFQHPAENNDTAEYRQYLYVKEDEQYDDLTLLAIRRKQ